MTGLPRRRAASMTARMTRGGQHALGVVGQHHRADLRQRRFGMGDDRGLGLRALAGAAVSQSARIRWVE